MYLNDSPSGLDGKESACNAGDLGSIPGLGRSPGEGKGYPFLENSMDCIAHGVMKSWTQLNDFHFIYWGCVELWCWRRLLRVPWTARRSNQPILKEISPGCSLEVQFSSVAQSCPTLCDPMNHSMPGLPVHHQLPEFTETHSVMPCTISSSVVPFSSCPQSLPASGSFPMSQLFA